MKNSFILFILLLINFSCVFADEFIIKKDSQEENIIYIPKNADHVKKFAAMELQKYLHLVSNNKFTIQELDSYKNNIKLTFFVGIAPKNKDKYTLQPEESCYQIIENKVFIYGDDDVKKKSDTVLKTIINNNNRTGTLFGVYDFLFHEVGVRWIWPGDEGIYYKKINTIKLKNKSYSWKPYHKFRLFRMTPFKETFLSGKKIKMYEKTPQSFLLSKKELYKRFEEESLWLRKMKLGMYEKPSYGHAFKDYWVRYGHKYPEWFAQDSFGHRGPSLTNKMKPDRMKLCIENKELQLEVIENLSYLKPRNNYYNACINDGRNFCKYSNTDSNQSLQNLSDRYVSFWNILSKGIKKHNRDAQLVVYAYQDLSVPPKISILNDNILVGIVPNYFSSPEVIKLNLTQWKNQGLKQFFLRPNDFNDDAGIPLGNEEYLFDRFKVYQDKNLLGIDYDRNYNYSNWELNGLSQYVLARAISEPSLPFENIADEYYSSFENSKNEIKDYYEYWRKLFKSRRLKDFKQQNQFIKKQLYKNIEQYYHENDFIRTKKILLKALEKENITLVVNRINKIILAHKHSYKMFLAMKFQKNKHLTNLERFRKNNKNKLLINWPILFHFEKYYKVY